MPRARRLRARCWRGQVAFLSDLPAGSATGSLITGYGELRCISGWMDCRVNGALRPGDHPAMLEQIANALEVFQTASIPDIYVRSASGLQSVKLRTHNSSAACLRELARVRPKWGYVSQADPGKLFLDQYFAALHPPSEHEAT